jgi:hypothetical protein
VTTLAELITSPTRTPTATAILNGRRWPGFLKASVGQEYGQGIGGATVEGRSPPSTPTPGMSIVLRAGYNGFEQPIFTGFVVVPTRASYPRRYSLQCMDVLWLAQQNKQPIAVSPLNDVTARAAIEYILETYAGLTRHAIPDIKRPSDSGTDWTLGQLTPVSWENETTALAACQQIAQDAGYWLYADAGGTVRARQLERRPSGSPFRVLRGSDAAGAALLEQGAPTRTNDANQVCNRIEVRGASTGFEGAQLHDVFLAPHALLPGVVNTLRYESQLLEYEADVTAVAERIARVWNRVPNTIPVRIKADPRLSVGTTVAIQDPEIGYTAPQNFFIYRLSTEIDLLEGRFDQQLVLDGGTGNGGFTTIPPPVAVIALRAIYKETIADGSQLVEVTVDGTGSYAQSEAEIVSYAWSTSGVYGSSATTATTPTAMFLYLSSASPVTISLTVTDTSSKTDTVSITIDLVNGDGVTSPTTEGWSTAGGAAWHLTIDGGGSWRVNVATTTFVPPFAAGVWETAGPADAGTYGAIASGGSAMYQTLDGLASPPTSLASASGTITALYVNPRNASRVWRAVGPLVQRSIDGGVSFTNWGTPAPGVDVVEIIEDAALDNSVFCLAGPNMYQSIGAAAPGWVLFFAGPSGAAARQMERSEDGTITWIAYTGTFVGSPLQRVEGPVAVAFTGASPAVTEVRAIALLDAVDPAAPQLVAIDSQNRIWVVDGLTGATTLSAATYPAGATVQHARASREIPMVVIADFDSVSAGTGGLQKYLVQADALLGFHNLDTGQQAHRVGLVSTGTPLLFQLIIPPAGVSGALDKISYYDSTTGVYTLKDPPKTGAYYWYVSASPFDRLRLIAFGNNNSLTESYIVSGGEWVMTDGTRPVWVSTDGGDTWTSVGLPDDGVTTTGLRALGLAEWDRVGGWWVSGNRGDVAAGQAVTLTWRGSGTTASAPIVTGTPTSDWFVAGVGVVGQSDEIWYPSFRPAAKARYLAGGSASTPAGSTPGDLLLYADGSIERHAAALSLTGGKVYATSDYRTAQPTLRVTVTGAVVLAWAQDGVYLVGGANGIRRVVDVFSAATVETAYADGATYSYVRAARQQQGLVVGVSESLGAPVYTVGAGSVWKVLAGPAGLDASHASRPELIDLGGLT